MANPGGSASTKARLAAERAQHAIERAAAEASWQDETFEDDANQAATANLLAALQANHTREDVHNAV